MISAGLVRVEVATHAAGIAPALADLHAICFAGSAQEPWSERAISTLIRTPGTLALIALGSEDDMNGFIIGRAIGDDGEILTLCISPAARRQGVATALIGRLRELLLPRRGLLLEVATTNQAARGLYQHLGFHEVGRRLDYYRRDGNAVDALVLVSHSDR